jgi:hypothetical protein
VTQISQKHQLRKTSTDNGDSQQRQQPYPSAKRDQPAPAGG